MLNTSLSRRRLLRGIVGGAILATTGSVLAACSNTAPAPTGGTNSGAPGQSGAPTKAPEGEAKPGAPASGAPSSKDAITLEWMTSVVDPAETLKTAQQGTDAHNVALGWQAMIGSFTEKHSNIKIKFINAPWGELLTKQQVAATGGNPGDVGYNEWGTEFGQLGIYSPLTLDGLDAKLFKGCLEGHSYQGKLYSVPQLSGCLALFYNKTHFEEAGLDPNKPPADWNEFQEMVATLTNKSKNRYGMDVPGSGSTYGGQMRYAPWLWSAGGDFFNADRDKVTWNEKPGIDSIALLAAVSQKYSVPGSASAAEATHADSWNAAQTSMFQDGPWRIGTSKEKQLNFGIAPIPPAPGSKPASLILGNAGNAIFSNAKNKDAALEFVKHFGEKETQLLGVKYITRLPSNKEAIEEAEVFKTDPYLKAFRDVFVGEDNHPLPVARVNNWKIQSIFRQYLEIALLGKSSPEEAWNKGAAEAQAVLAGPELQQEDEKK